MRELLHMITLPQALMLAVGVAAMAILLRRVFRTTHLDEPDQSE